MNVPEDREYTHSHEWVRMDGESAVVGIVAGDSAMTSAAVRVSLPEERSSVKSGDVVATIYFADGEREVCAPLSGSIIEVNHVIESDPQLVGVDPYGAGWLFRLKIEAGEEIEHLLGPAVYNEQLRAAEAMDTDSP
jgi:glycine cleavage system H protein